MAIDVAYARESSVYSWHIYFVVCVEQLPRHTRTFLNLTYIHKACAFHGVSCVWE